MKAKGGYSIAIYLFLRIYLIAAETGGPTQTASANTNGINGEYFVIFVWLIFAIQFEFECELNLVFQLVD